jgi:hypothetical protein
MQVQHLLVARDFARLDRKNGWTQEAHENEREIVDHIKLYKWRRRWWKRLYGTGKWGGERKENRRQSGGKRDGGHRYQRHRYQKVVNLLLNVRREC